MHASALVIVPREMADDIPSAVSSLMAPHREVWNPATKDYDGWWDWHRIGGRWDGTILGLDQLSEETHYTDEWEQPERNCVEAVRAAEYATYTVVSPNGYAHREIRNPDWDGEDYATYLIDNPDYYAWRAQQLMEHRDGIAVVVDYHS